MNFKTNKNLGFPDLQSRRNAAATSPELQGLSMSPDPFVSSQSMLKQQFSSNKDQRGVYVAVPTGLSLCLIPPGCGMKQGASFP